MLRHGRTAWNLERRIQGRTDIPLAPEGRRELTGARVPVDIAGARWFTSPLLRARETAALLGAPAAIADERLTEMDFGAWEGQTHAQIASRDPAGLARQEARGLDMRPPGGETPREVQARLIAFLDARDGPDPVVAVSHKGVIRAALALASDWTMTADPPWRIDWRAALLFDWSQGHLTIERLNVSLDHP